MNLLEKHLTGDQLRWIHDQNVQFGPEKLEELRNEWIEATEGLQKAMKSELSRLTEMDRDDADKSHISGPGKWDQNLTYLDRQFV